MAKLGFKPGDSLGKKAPSPPPPSSSSPSTGQDPDGKQGEEGGDAGTGTRTRTGRNRTEPLNLVFKEDRGGIGLDSEKKRKIREEAQEAAKKVKHEEGDYRDRVREERETRRTEAQVHAAQKVAERLDVDADADADADNDNDNDNDNGKGESGTGARAKPTSQLPVLYRGLVRERENKERDLYARHHLQTSLPSSFFPNPRLPGYDDDSLERDDREALDHPRQRSVSSSPSHEEDNPSKLNVFEEEVEGEDPELDEFNALEPSDRLHRLVLYLRDQHWYCFWCKSRYDTEKMEGCPGLTEEDHD